MEVGGPGGAPLWRVEPPSDEGCAKRIDLQHRRRDQPGMEDVERGLLLVLHILTDPFWAIEIHATVNGASFGSWGRLLLGHGPCHRYLPYKVGHFWKMSCDFLGT